MQIGDFRDVTNIAKIQLPQRDRIIILKIQQIQLEYAKRLVLCIREHINYGYDKIYPTKRGVLFFPEQLENAAKLIDQSCFTPNEANLIKQHLDSAKEIITELEIGLRNINNTPAPN